MSDAQAENDVHGVRSGPPVSMLSRNKLVGFAFVVCTALGWGLNWPATKRLVALCPPFSARSVAGLCAACVLFAAAALNGERLAIPRRLWGRFVLAGLLNVTAWMGLTTMSLLWLPAGQAAILAYTMPVWAAILAWPLLSERPSWRQLAAIALGIGGVVIEVGGANLSVDLAAAKGTACALAAAVLFATGTVLFKRAPLPTPRLTTTAWQILLGSLPMLGAGLVLETPHFATLPPVAWAFVGYTALVSMGLCYVLWFAAIGRLKAAEATVGTLLTPVIGVTASSLALHDPLAVSQLVSLTMVVAGIVLAVRA